MKSDPIEITGRLEEESLDVPRLRREMVDLWRMEGESHREAGAVNRACLSTLAVPSVPGDGVEEFLQELVPLFPSRVLLVRTDPGLPEGSARAWVTGWCSRKTEGGSLVCSEVVHMHAGPKAEPRLASAVRSLSVGGLPVLVLAPTVSPLEVGWIGLLGDDVDLVVGDSSALAPPDGVALWRRCVSPDPPRYEDLLWNSLGDWRRALAQWFDRPEETDTAHEIREAEIEVADTEGGVQKAWLLAGWLGSRLGWKLRGSDGARILLDGPRGEVQVLVRPVSAGDDPALTLSVTLRFRDPDRVLSWRRMSSERAIVVERGKDGDRLFRLNQTKTDRPSAVVQILHRHQPDPVAEAAMNLAVHLGRGKR